MAENIVRQSQLITTYGPGAMLDLPDHSVIVMGLQHWARRGRERIEEPRLKAKLCRLLNMPRVELHTPPRHEDSERGKAAPVGAKIFPTWFIVKDAKPSPRNRQWRRRRLVQWRNLHHRRRAFKDPDDGKLIPVVPVRFVCACRRGHLDDLKWNRFVHEDGQICGRPLWLEERGTSGDIVDTYCVCECGAERSLAEVGSTEGSALGHCEGKRPWIGLLADEKCGEPYRLLVRTASDAYFPQIMSVISLPEYDAGLAEKVAEQFDRLKTADDLGSLSDFRRIPELNAAFADVADDEVIAEYERQKGGGQGEEVPVKVAEFAVLDHGGKCVGQDDPRSKFHAETLDRHTWDPDAKALLAPIDKLVLVHRLREVAALLGFTRFEAVSPDKDGELDLNVSRAALTDTLHWFPAIEHRGEGVFVSFDQDAVDAWLERAGTTERGAQIEKAWTQWATERELKGAVFPGLPYIMLHSLSHMLMTSIALDCGYPASSMRERVYAGDGGHGILIYTGSSDSEGTLGGLVEAGRRFAEHLERCLKDSLLCSNDPVCAEHKPDAPHETRPLQGAACHGCLLIAETSCEQRNDLLDRALVVPTVGVRDAAFFDGGYLGP